MLPVAAPGAFGERLRERAAVEPHRVAEFDEEDGESGVLTERHPFLPGDPGVFQILVEEVTGRFAALFGPAGPERLQNVGRQVTGGLAAELGHGLCNGFKRENSNGIHDILSLGCYKFT